MSLHSLLARYVDRPGASDALSDSDALAAQVLAALPRTSTLPDADHDDARTVASVVAILRHRLDGMPILEAVAYAWTAARDESIRDSARAATPADDDADTLAQLAEALPDRTTLPRAATYRPDAAYGWTVSDVVTVALSLLDDSQRDLLALVLSAPEESYGAGGRSDLLLPGGAWLCSAAALSGMVPDGTDPRSRTGRRLLADARAALSSLRDACAVVTAWSSATRARDYWTDDARAVADAVADAVARDLDARGTTCATGTATSGPASPVVVRYRDSLADAWRVVVTEHEETSTDDAGEETTTSTACAHLLSLSPDDAARALDSLYAVPAYVRTRATLDADAWADRLGWTPGPVRKSRSRKGSRVGSTGPTVPVGRRP